MSSESFATINIPFESERHAEIVYKVLSVDKEPKRNFVRKDLRLDGNTLTVHFAADQAKNLRASITSFFDSLLLCKETIKQFDLNN